MARQAPSLGRHPAIEGWLHKTVVNRARALGRSEGRRNNSNPAGWVSARRRARRLSGGRRKHHGRERSPAHQAYDPDQNANRRPLRIDCDGAGYVPVAAEQFIPPDPSIGGGWPGGTSYFYLPKRVLGSVGISSGLCQSNRLTDDTAVLFGVSPPEREAVDAALDTLWRNFRSLEIQKMTQVDVPARIIAFGKDPRTQFPRVMVVDENRRVWDTRLLNPLNVPTSSDDPVYYYARLLGIELPQPADAQQ